MQNVLNPLEKKLFDIKQMIIIKEQCICALDIIIRNNKEVIRNIDNIKNVTITAMNIAVIVAKSLYNQKIILNKIKNLEYSTSNFINNTGSIIKNQSNLMYDSTVERDNVESLKCAFEDIFRTIKDVDSHNKKFFPENEMQIIELKKMEENYDKK